MTKALKVPIKQAEKWKKYLSDNDLFGERYRPFKEDGFMFYPVKKEFDVEDSENDTAEFIEMAFKTRNAKGTLKENMMGKLNAQELAFLQTAHDIIGDIAILEIPQELEKHERLMAETLLKINPKIKTVLKKSAMHEGIYRTQKMKYLAGIDTKEAIYRENGVILKLDVEQVYFSIRLSNERKRIAKQVKPGEEILVMFSGCAPYCMVLSKNTTAKHILGIEINPAGHTYGLENIKLNKTKNVDLICGDVKDVIPQLKTKNPHLSFDRILMPLPKTADEFLDVALSVSKKGTIIHFYDFLEEGKFTEAVDKIDYSCKELRMAYRVLEIVKCGQHAPHVFRICVDFMIV